MQKEPFRSQSPGFWLLGCVTLGKCPKLSGLHILLQDGANNSHLAKNGGHTKRKLMQSTQLIRSTQKPLPISVGLDVCMASRRGAGPPPAQNGSGRARGVGAAAKDRAAEMHTGTGCLFRHFVWNESPFIPATEVSRTGQLVLGERLP